MQCGLVGAVMVGALALPAAAGDSKVNRQGLCSAASTYQLNLAEQKGVLGVDFVVNSKGIGEQWRFVLQEDGKTFFQGGVTNTKGVLKASAKTNNEDEDFVKAIATNLTTGEVCQTTVRIDPDDDDRCDDRFDDSATADRRRRCRDRDDRFDDSAALTPTADDRDDDRCDDRFDDGFGDQAATDDRRRRCRDRDDRGDG
ncbi:hypothetical protein [Gloeobacter morelensis]|uniref:Uncharacterized protein n=1 Tax=Gloeobacter morelensis MG652769 TaxID=2781736 RepID=A0ABY3PJ26_9CYAN|nr:hypothetical protein [Gloeobacter morelensis]UFP93552.1 hypothetical protein ISF26_17415 [Gloeobacter morelensis MG652769]